MKWLSTIYFSLIGLLAIGQQSKLQAQGKSPYLHLLYTVKVGDTWYGLSKLYNTTSQSIAVFNRKTDKEVLKPEDELQIPLNANNFTQDGQMKADEALVPVYHTVQNGETLYRISLNHNKVAIDKIKEWNNINRNEVFVGQELIVGHLKVKKDKLASIGGGIVTTPVVKQPDPEPQPVKPTPQPVVIPPKKVEEPTPNTPSGTDASGVFAGQFTAQGKTLQSLTGDAAAFKTTSGWNDKKYYALINGITPGTIVKVSIGDKVIYAKVLGSLPDIKENKNLLLRISNAAASVLGVGDLKFSVALEYYQ
jgi:LysM repeat protein